MSTDDEEKKMAAFVDKLCCRGGVSVVYQKKAENPRKGSLRLDGANGSAPVFILKRVSSRGCSKKSEILWKDVAGVFGSTDKHARAAVVLIGATRQAGDRHVRIDSWRFTVDEDNAPSPDAVMEFLRSKGEVATGILCNIFPTHGSDVTGETLGFSESALNEEGLGGASISRMPEILVVCEQMFKIGESAAMVAPVFSLFAAIVSNYETVQILKFDFIDLLARWSRIEGSLVGEGRLRRDLLALAEDFFIKPGWRRRLASKDFQSNLARLAERMDRAAQGQVLDNTEIIKGMLGTLLSHQQLPVVHEKAFDWTTVQSILPQEQELTGRREELKAIGTELRRRGSIVALSGVAGCGKSHLGIEAGLSWTREEPLRVAFFLSMENEVSFRSWLLKIMKKVGLEPLLQENGKPIRTEELVRRIYERFEGAPPGFQVLWLLDNVPVEGGIDLLSLWFGPAESRDSNRFCYLLTSQSAVYRGKTPFGVVKMIEVDPLPTDDAVALLTNDFSKLLAQEGEMSAAKELVEEFCHNLPVAILAVVGMINRPLTFRGYLKKLYEKKVTAGVDSVAGILHDALLHARQSDGVARILDVAAFVSPDDIPLSLLEDEDLVGRLCEMNLLQVVSHEHYSMHRLIQEAARDGRSAASAIAALENVLHLLYDPDSHATWAASVAMLPHVESLRSAAELTYILSNVLPEETMRLYGRLMSNYGRVYSTVLCNFLSSRQLQQDALTVYRAVCGETAVHLDIASTLKYLGRVCNDLGDYERAKDFLKQALVMYRAVYGKTGVHSDIANTLNNLGLFYLNVGDYKQAKDFFEQALVMKRAVYGETAGHSDIASALHNLGIVYCDLGDYDRARDFYEQALVMERAMHAETAVHLSIAKTLHNLGGVCLTLGDFARARDFYEQALSMYRAVHGEKAVHLDIARTLHNLGVVYRNLGDYDRAKDFFEQDLAMSRDVYGETAIHSAIAMTLNNLGIVYYTLGDYEQAKDFFVQALVMKRAVYGETAVHSDIAKTLMNLGIVSDDLGDYEQAKGFSEQALSMYRAVYGETAVHLDISMTLNNLGSVCLHLGDYEQAKKFLEQALEMDRAVYGETAVHLEITKTLKNIGIVCLSLGEYGPAKDFFEQALVMLRAVHGEIAAHSDIAKTLYHLGLVYLNRKDYAQARDFFEQALSMYLAVHGKTAVHFDIATTLSNLGMIYCILGDIEQGRGICEQALSMFRVVYSGNDKHPWIEPILFLLNALA